MDAQKEKLRDQICEAGLRVTGPRLAVLEVLRRAGKPLSHGEVADVLERDGIDRATIYRNLQDLVEAGILSRTDFGAVWHFELAGKGADHASDGHPHFVCSECGVVSCLPGARIDVKVPKPSPKTVRSGRFEVQLRGVCDRCT